MEKAIVKKKASLTVAVLSIIIISFTAGWAFTIGAHYANWMIA